MKSKTLIYSAIAVTALGVGSVLGAVGMQVVNAQTNNDSAYSKLVENIAAKFGLKEADVQQVFDDTRDQEYVDRLSEAVSDGDITEDQKSKIIEKHKEFEAKVEEINNKQLTAEERRTAMRDLHDDMQKWADENDIPLRYVMFGGKGKIMHIKGDGFGMGMHQEMM